MKIFSTFRNKILDLPWKAELTVSLCCVYLILSVIPTYNIVSISNLKAKITSAVDSVTLYLFSVAGYHTHKCLNTMFFPPFPPHGH